MRTPTEIITDLLRKLSPDYASSDPALLLLCEAVVASAKIKERRRRADLIRSRRDLREKENGLPDQGGGDRPGIKYNQVNQDIPTVYFSVSTGQSGAHRGERRWCIIHGGLPVCMMSSFDEVLFAADEYYRKDGLHGAKVYDGDKGLFVGSMHRPEFA